METARRYCTMSIRHLTDAFFSFFSDRWNRRVYSAYPKSDRCTEVWDVDICWSVPKAFAFEPRSVC